MQSHTDNQISKTDKTLMIVWLVMISIPIIATGVMYAFGY